MVFTDQPSSHNFISHIFMLDLHTFQYLALHDLINIMKNSDSIFTCKTAENDENKLLITFPEEHISLDRFDNR